MTATAGWHLASTITSDLSEDEELGSSQTTTAYCGTAPPETSPSGRAHATGPASQSSADSVAAATVFLGMFTESGISKTGPRPEIVTTHASSYLFKYMLKPASAPPRRRRLVFHCVSRQTLL